MFYRDHFGFRNGLIRGHNWIRYKLCKGSSLGKVLFGKDDWLFLTKSGILPDFLGQNPMTGADLDAWRDALEQLLDYLGNHSSVNFIDLRPVLLQAKTSGLIYHPKDSHWTDRGAFVAYEQICRRLGEWFDDIRPLSRDGFELAKGKEPADLSMMLGDQEHPDVVIEEMVERKLKDAPSSHSDDVLVDAAR